MFESFPRPRGDTGIGIHYFPDSDHFGEQDLARWLPEMKSLGFSWVTLQASPRETIPLDFLQGLRAADIEPVIVIKQEPGFKLEQAALAEQAAHYARAGVHYISCLREPNVEANWSVQEWQRPNLVSRIMRVVLPALETFVEANLYPLLPPLRPGGDYWDLAFLAAMLDGIVERGSPPLQERLGLCIHNYAFNRPLTWGAGGQARWPDARPYSSSGEDHRGWRLWEWYDELVNARLGRSLPMICGATGVILGERDQPDLPAATMEEHRQRNLDILLKMQRGDLPDYLLNQNFWLLAAPPGHPGEEQAWFGADNSTLPIVAELQQQPSGPRRESAPKTAAATAAPGHLSHYLLLPAWDWGVSSIHWEAIHAFVQVVQPTVGFRIEEAARATRVTTLVGAHGFDETVIERLREAGCEVDCVPASDHATMQEAFTKRAEAARKR